jgi:hypothetical protein
MQLHSWRRHLHKYDDMDEATAKANAKALKEKVRLPHAVPLPI